MEQAQFLKACEKIIQEERVRDGIGTLSEKTVHAVLKQYLEPDKTKQEIRVGKHVADILSEAGIIEIQTRQFNRLRDKLSAFLPEYPVTVVYPIPGNKRLHWVNPDTGEVSNGRRSPRKGSMYDVFFELYKIKSYLTHPHMRLHLLILEMEEYRYLNGWSKDKKRGSVRMDRIPKGIEAEYMVERTEDYMQFIPYTLEDGFTSRDFAREAHITKECAQVALNILLEVGVVERTGKQGNNYQYRVAY